MSRPIPPCAAWAALLATPHDELAPGDRATLDAHVASCAACAAARADYRRMDAALRALPAPDPLPGLPPRLLRRWAAEGAHGTATASRTRAGGLTGIRSEGHANRSEIPMSIVDRPTAPGTTARRPQRRAAGWLGASAATAVVLLFALAFFSLSHRGAGPHLSASVVPGSQSTAVAAPTTGWDAAYLGADGHLHLVTPDGKSDIAGPTLPGTQLLTQAELGWADAAASPDGRYVAYVQGSDPNGGSAVAIVAVATGKITTVTTPCANLYWSPDGTRLAADAHPIDSAGTMAIIDVASGKATSVVGSYQGQPAQVFRAVGWIDGAHLAVLANVPGPAARAPSGAAGRVRARPRSGGPGETLAALDVASGALRPIRALTTAADPFPPDVFLAPDGKEALFASSTWQPTAQVIDLATGATRPLPHVTAAFAGKFVDIGNFDFEGGNWATLMAWRPGGHTLALSLAAFGVGTEGTIGLSHQSPGVWLVDLDADTASPLTSDSYPLAWLPDGTTLLTGSLPPASVLYGGLSVGPVLTAVDAAAPTAPSVVLGRQMVVFFGLVRAS